MDYKRGAGWFFYGMALMGVGVSGVKAQSLIVGIPSADVAKKGHFEFTHESQWAPKKHRLEWTSFNFLTYGLNERTEIALSLVNVSSPASRNVALGVGFKTYVPIPAFETNVLTEPKLTLGQMVYFSTGRPADNPNAVGGWVYSHYSTRLRPTRTRLTAGLSYGSSHVFGFRSLVGNEPLPAGPVPRVPLDPFCVLAGLEQPITKRFGFVMDWISGRHDIAAVIPALQFTLPHQVLIFGYKRDNNRQARSDAFVTEVMFHF